MESICMLRDARGDVVQGFWFGPRLVVHPLTPPAPHHSPRALGRSWYPVECLCSDTGPGTSAPLGHDSLGPVFSQRHRANPEFHHSTDPSAHAPSGAGAAAARCPGRRLCEDLNLPLSIAVR